MGLGLGLTCASILLSCSRGEAIASGSAPVGEPTGGGALRIVQETPESLDPAKADTVYASLPVNQLFDGLVTLDPSLNIVPCLASTWTISRDGKSYTFHLRPDVKFHDGTPLTADDVVFTFRRVLEPNREPRSIAASYIPGVEGAAAFTAGKRHDLPGVVALDAHTVSIRLERPYISFLEVLAMDGLRVVPRRVLEAEGDKLFERSPVGTGPFRFESWDTEGLHLAANKGYFASAPYVDRLDIFFLGSDEADQGTERFKRGDVDVLVPPPDQLEDLSSRPDVTIVRYQELNLSFFGLSTGTPPLEDVRLRQAIAHAINRQALVANAPATRRLATGILPPGLQGYSPQPKALAYDPALARKILADAGFPDGRGLRPVVMVSSAKSRVALKDQENLRTDLAAVGIELDIRHIPWTEMNRRLDDHAAPAFQLGWIADLADPDSFLRSLFESST